MIDDARRFEGVRKRNLARVFGLVHHGGAHSRAQLTEATGLNRSTIADLVSSLVTLGLLLEQAPDSKGRVGRPSPVVSVSALPVTIAVNPEVDALEIAVVGLDHRVRVRSRVELDRLLSPRDVADAVARQIGSWRDSALAASHVLGVGIAVPGLVRASDGVVRDAPHLNWRDAPLAELVRDATRLPVAVGNDASLGAIAEHLYGAARGVSDVIYLNGGASGIGGGLIIGGHPVRGAGGYAGEFGHNRPGVASPQDRRGRDGVLEEEVSRARLLAALHLTHADDAELSEFIATRRTPDALDEAQRQRRILATALSNATNVLNPSMIVLGGFLAALAELDIPGLETMVREQSMLPVGEDLTIAPAALAGDRLIVGAAEAALDVVLQRSFF